MLYSKLNIGFLTEALHPSRRLITSKPWYMRFHRRTATVRLPPIPGHKIRKFSSHQ